MCLPEGGGSLVTGLMWKVTDLCFDDQRYRALLWTLALRRSTWVPPLSGVASRTPLRAFVMMGSRRAGPVGHGVAVLMSWRLQLAGDLFGDLPGDLGGPGKPDHKSVANRIERARSGPRP